MNFNDLLSEILEHPQARTMVNKIQQKLTKEEKDRAAFREWLNGDVKAEFINGEVVMHSPAKRGHLNATGNLFKLLDTYVDIHKLGAV